MLRFNAFELYEVCREAWNLKCKVVLAKDHGVYLLAEHGSSDDRGRRKNIAYAEGMHPDRDEVWYETARRAVGGDDFAETLPIAREMFEGLVFQERSLRLSLSETEIDISTGFESWIPVAEYRDHTDRLFTLANPHFNACRGATELASWRAMAMRHLADTAFINCKRAQPRDHSNFLSAYRQLYKRTRTVTPSGAIIMPVH